MLNNKLSFYTIRIYNHITPIFIFFFRGECCTNFYISDDKCIGVYKHILSLNLNNITILKDKVFSLSTPSTRH